MRNRNEQPALKADDVAELLGLNRKTVYKLANEGVLGSFRIGRKLLFSPADVEQYLMQSNSQNVTDNSSLALPAQNTTHVSDETIVLAGDDLAADVIANYTQSAGMPVARIHESSYCGLVGLYKERTDATLLHLYDQRTKSYNTPYVQRMAPGVPLVTMRLFQRPVGLLVRKQAAGCTTPLRTWADLACNDVRIATRPKGYAMRILLDEMLLGLEANLVRMEQSYIECASELDLAEAVVTGRADVGVASIDTQNLVPGAFLYCIANRAY